MVGGLHQERQLKVCDVICNLSIHRIRYNKFEDVYKMKRTKSFFWQLNTPFLFYANMKTATVNNLIEGFLALPYSLHTHFALLCKLYYLRHSIEIFRGSSLWIGVAVLLKN